MLFQPPLVGVVSIGFSVRINHFHADLRTRAGRPRGDFGLTSRNTGHVFGITFPSFWRHTPLSRQFSSTADHYGCSCTIFPYPFSVTVFVGGHYWRALRGVPIGGLPNRGARFCKKKKKKFCKNRDFSAIFIEFCINFNEIFFFFILRISINNLENVDKSSNF